MSTRLLKPSFPRSDPATDTFPHFLGLHFDTLLAKTSVTGENSFLPYRPPRWRPCLPTALESIRLVPSFLQPLPRNASYPWKSRRPSCRPWHPASHHICQCLTACQATTQNQVWFPQPLTSEVPSLGGGKCFPKVCLVKIRFFFVFR